MNAGKVFLIRFDADEHVGMGHFNRCFALGRQLSDVGENVIFAAKHISPHIENVLLAANQKYLKIPNAIGWSEEVDFLKEKCSGGFSNFILDVATAYAFEDLAGMTAYLNKLRECAKIVMLDGMGENALSTKIQTSIDVIVVPYFGANELMPKLNQKTVYLRGPKYHIFSPEYRNGHCPKREIRKAADRVLVTLGGADPLSVTIKVIEAILFMRDVKCQVRLVIGPNFSPELKEKMQDMAKSSFHHFTVIDCPKSLLEHMLWCDVAVTGPGLTKYELAVTGTPSLQIAFNQDHVYVSDFFVRQGSIKNLGVHSDVGIDLLASDLNDLLRDYESRKRMSDLGQNLLDTHGVNRIIEAIRS